MNPPFLYALRPLYNLLRPGGQRSWIRGFAPPCSCCRIARVAAGPSRRGSVMKVSSKPVAWLRKHDGPRINRFVPYHNEIAAIGTLNFRAFLLCTTVCGTGTEILVAASDDFRTTFTWYGNQCSGCFTPSRTTPMGRVSGATALLGRINLFGQLIRVRVIPGRVRSPDCSSPRSSARACGTWE